MYFIDIALDTGSIVSAWWAYPNGEYEKWASPRHHERWFPRDQVGACVTSFLDDTPADTLVTATRGTPLSMPTPWGKSLPPMALLTSVIRQITLRLVISDLAITLVRNPTPDGRRAQWSHQDVREQGYRGRSEKPLNGVAKCTSAHPGQRSAHKSSSDDEGAKCT